jgi:hypothetical protein
MLLINTKSFERFKRVNIYFLMSSVLEPRNNHDTYSNLYNLAYSKHIRLYDFITECDDI